MLEARSRRNVGVRTRARTCRRRGVEGVVADQQRGVYVRSGGGGGGGGDDDKQGGGWSAAVYGLAPFGAVVGPVVDGLHNQTLLTYELMPVILGPLHTSLVVPPLLALAYPLLGGVLPFALDTILPSAASTPRTGGPAKALRERPAVSAALAVATTAALVRSSAVLPDMVGREHTLLPLCGLAVLQWALLDGSLSALGLACAAALLGPLAELPLVSIGWWQYLPQATDYLPFGADAQWAALPAVTAPCYFAVTTDAIAVGRLLRSRALASFK
ncbi:hypothetical protein RI054_14g68560 [Pseudoscourfieldia marina]